MSETSSNQLAQIEKLFYLTIVILLFQITRNINTLAYVTLLFGSYALLYIVYLSLGSKNREYLKIVFTPLELMFIMTIIWIPIISLFYMEPADSITAIARYFVTLPFILFSIIYKKYSYNFIRKTLRTLSGFMVIASLSIPFQIIFGPINFFADTSIREGIVRYASLAGSLTTLGTLGAFALAILLFSDNFLFGYKTKYTLIILLIAGMLMSLQKAALVNILICVFAYIMFYGQISIIKRITSVLVLSIATYLLYLIAQDTNFGLYINSLFDYTSNGSYGVKQDFMSRMWQRPSQVALYNDIGLINIFFGIGLSPLGGIMGLENFPQDHNNYFDLIFTGGIIHFIAVIILMLRIPFKVLVKKIKKYKINYIDRTYSVIVFLFLINMAIGAGSFYQPICAVFLFFIIFTYDRVNNLI